MGTGTGGSGITSRDHHIYAVYQVSGAFSRTDTSAKLVSHVALPAGALVVGAGVYVQTAFNDSGYSVVDIGTEADPDAFAANLDVSSVGLKLSADLDTASGLYFEDSARCVVAFYGENGNSTAGSGLAFVKFIKIG